MFKIDYPNETLKQAPLIHKNPPYFERKCIKIGMFVKTMITIYRVIDFMTQMFRVIKRTNVSLNPIKQVAG